MTLRREPGLAYAWLWLALLAGVVALLGGSSRFDAIQATALRPLVALFLIPGLYLLTREQVKEAGAPVVILALFALWTAVQLVPLPPFLWQALPGRDLTAQLDTLHGIEGAWRPISYVPMRGWNALFGLIVPIGAALLVMAMRPKIRDLLLILVVVGVIDAGLGILQTLSGKGSALYFYTHTNDGAPVGIFANENHSGVFSAMILLLITRLGFSKAKPGNPTVFNVVLAAAFLLVTLAILISGSRAALGLGLASLGACALIAALSLPKGGADSRATRSMTVLARHPRLLLLAGIAAVSLLLYVFLGFERAPGLIQAINQDTFEDLRWRVSPVLFDMMSAHWLVGTGFGTFDAAYIAFEPTNLMLNSYLNQAHNDWAQIVIEGGIPAVLLLLALVRWLFFAVGRLYAPEPKALANCLFWCAILGIVAIASLFDYPLRTPIYQLACVWLLLALASDGAEESNATS